MHMSSLSISPQILLHFTKLVKQSLVSAVDSNLSCLTMLLLQWITKKFQEKYRRGCPHCCRVGFFREYEEKSGFILEAEVLYVTVQIKVNNQNAANHKTSIPASVSLNELNVY